LFGSIIMEPILVARPSPRTTRHFYLARPDNFSISSSSSWYSLSFVVVDQGG
jgi:hypothetical protein